jgi:serine phosphatase RsbU (regulator of sigma subunit)
MSAVNNDLRSIFGARSFMTAMCVALDPATGKASVVGAGHPPLLVMRQGQAAELIISAAPPLGVLERSKFTETTVDLLPGDGFFLHTDGLYVPSGRNVTRWTPERLQELLNRPNESADALLARILQAIAPNENEPLADDLAALVVRHAPEKIFSEGEN